MRKVSSTYRAAAAERGFTLTELMIVVVIVAILAAVGYPSYTSHVERSQRNDGRAALSRVANDLERFFATNGTYTTDATQTSMTISGGAAYSDNERYKIEILPGPTGTIATSYRILAAAYGAQAGDEECPTLTLDSTGTRTPDPATSACW